MKLQEIKKFSREFSMPDSLKLNSWSTIFNLDLFFESHIATIDSPLNSKRIKMIHYNRLLEVIKVLREEQGEEKNMTNPIKQKPPLDYEQIDKTKDMDNNSIDLDSLNIQNESSAIRPNNDFESDVQIQKENKKKVVLNEPNKIIESEKETTNSDNEQMSLF